MVIVNVYIGECFPVLYMLPISSLYGFHCCCHTGVKHVEECVTFSFIFFLCRVTNTIPHFLGFHLSVVGMKK